MWLGYYGGHFLVFSRGVLQCAYEVHLGEIGDFR